MEIVLNEGDYVPDKVNNTLDKDNIVSAIDLLYPPGHNEGRIAIPLKYLLSLSVVLILLGTGTVLISKSTATGI